ncbi:helix-turn-helix transcriptional regulator [Sphingomonas panacisoli]|uniref:Helix-turn-helix transcriptional regulator n=1 Tax=Sphingomonas panacisoli TaxID=1813879 RepID=A0A5B8LKP3_9SPHN|nr:AraC family transcriptional regulator [Sphingomonas panacisoli]QDZ08154.1 helix-turn-helix transcriptional regulator [Sphingomonas panacisoli]
MSDIGLDYRVPGPDVADYATLFYFFNTDLAVFEDTERADHAQVRFRLDDGAAEYHFPDGTVQQAPPVHVLGPTSAAFKVRAEGPVRLFGWGVTAGGWGAMMGGDASNALNRMLDGVAVLGQRIMAARAQFQAARDIDEMAAIATCLIRDLVGDACDDVVQFARQVDSWLEDSNSPEIDDLITATGLSRRQVERKCNAIYGAPPKLLARKFRALRAAVAMRGRDLSFDDAVGHGFYDQSHLIREVKQFTGLTPKQIRDQPTALAAITVAQRTALNGQVKTLISET